MAVGDKLDFEKPFTVSLSTQNKPPGAGRQHIKFTCDDGSEILINVIYTYAPAPVFEPAYVLFQRDDSEVNVRLKNCLNCDRISVAAVEAPRGLNWQINAENSSEHLEITFKVDRSVPQLQEEGVMEVRLALPQDSIIKLPYLVLGKAE